MKKEMQKNITHAQRYNITMSKKKIVTVMEPPTVD